MAEPQARTAEADPKLAQFLPRTTTQRRPRRTAAQAVKRERAHPPENETKRDRFLRIGQARMVNALHAIRLIGNLAGQNYEVNANDLALMHNTIEEAVEQAFGKFALATGAPKLEETFSLTNGG